MCVSRQRRPLGNDQARSWEHEEGAGVPRVLIESPDGAEAHAAWRLLQHHGCRTMWCPGPSAAAGTECVLSQSGHCARREGRRRGVCARSA